MQGLSQTSKPETSSSLWKSCISAWVCLTLRHLPIPVSSAGTNEAGDVSKIPWIINFLYCSSIFNNICCVPSAGRGCIFVLLGLNQHIWLCFVSFCVNLSLWNLKRLGVSFLSFSEIVRKKTLFKGRHNLNLRLQLRCAALQVFMLSCRAVDFQPLQCSATS